VLARAGNEAWADQNIIGAIIELDAQSLNDFGHH